MYNYNIDGKYNRENIYSKYIKRPLDFLLALLLIIIVSPILLITCIFIKNDSEGPVLFTQKRVGQFGKEIQIFKLRTMIIQSHDSNGKKIRDRDRVTKSGKIIRKLSLDELPQLINVIRGDMSFIGPRPLLIRYFPYYSEIEVQRHNVKPGITGLAQVKGRSYLQWDQRFQYDVDYVENISLGQDVRIFFETIKSVFTGKGTSTVRPEGLVDFDEHRNFIKVRGI